MFTYISNEAIKSHPDFLDPRCPFTGLESCCTLRKNEEGHCKPRGVKGVSSLK